MPQRFLIDGYNLLHALGLPKRLGVGGLQRARQELLAFVRRRCAGAECTVVFDGTQASGRQDDNGVAVLFAKGEADELIRELVGQDSSPKSLCVVSSDHAVQAAAKRRRANVMDAEDFIEQPESRPAPPTTDAPEKPALEVEVQHWLEVFGAIERDPAVRKMQAIEPLKSGKNKRKRK